MPLLDQSYISNLYYFTVENNYLFLEHFDENQIQKNVSAKRLIQGDIGHYLINVGGTRWESNLGSRVFILSNFTTMPIISTLDLLKNAYSDDNFVLNETYDFSIIMKRATIDIDPEGVKCALVCWSDTSSITDWIKINNQIGNLNSDFIGRLARFYDTSLSFKDDWNFFVNMSIKSASISIEVDINEHFFIKRSSEDSSPYPIFFIQGYVVSGEIHFVCPFENNFYINNLEKFKQRIQGRGIILNVANNTFDLSPGKLIVEKLTKTIDQNKVVTMSLAFTSSATKIPL
jgi:hypothetical protein